MANWHKAGIVLSLVVAACGHEQPPLQQPQPEQSWDEFIRSRPSTYIQSRTEQLAIERQRLERLGLVKDYATVRALVDRYLPPGNYILQEPGATAEILRRQRIDSTTVAILNFGYRARHLAAPQQAYSIVRAAASGYGDPDSLVLLSPTVLVADRIGIDRRADNSAYLVYRVTEAIKSSPLPGVEFRLLLNDRFPTVTAPPGAPPPPPPPPNPGREELSRHGTVLFFLDGLKMETEGALIADTNFGPMPVSGNHVSPGYHSATQETTLDAVRAAARAQLCSPGYVPVVEGANLPRSC